MSKVYVPKRYDNYADVLITFGLSKMIRYALNSKNNLILEDYGDYLIIQTDENLEELNYEIINFEFLLPYIEQNSKTRPPNPPEWAKENYIPTRPDKEFKEYTIEEHISNNSQSSGQGLRSKHAINKVCEILFNNQEYFGNILEAFIKGHLNLETDTQLIKDKISEFNEDLAKYLFRKRTALQALFPQGCKGFNYEDLSGATKTGSDRGRQRIYNYELLLASIGLWETTIYFPLFTNQGKQSIIVSILNPEYIARDVYSGIRESIKEFWAGTPTKYNTLFLLATVIELIDRSEELRKDDLEISFFKPSDFINSIETTTFRSLGNAYVPFNITKFAIPNWAFIDENIGSEELRESIVDIRDRIRYLDEDRVGLELFTELINFFNSEDLQDLLNFFYEFNLYLTSTISNDKSARIRSYQKQTMEVIMNRLDKTNKTEYSKILENEGFINVAKAIRNVTVVAIYRSRSDESLKKLIHFGLASELKRASLTKKSLLEWLTDFCSTYNANLDRLAFQHPDKPLPFARLREDDVKEVIRLVDESNEPKIIGGLLLAYGLASSKKVEEEVETDEEEAPAK